LGIVTVNETLQHKVKEVSLELNNNAKEIFPADENGRVYIVCTDKEKGIVEKKGELIMINSFGKKVKIPFSFKYNNE
jgi:hypothetical protein